jgi:hypothetical protein
LGHGSGAQGSGAPQLVLVAFALVASVVGTGAITVPPAPVPSALASTRSAPARVGGEHHGKIEPPSRNVSSQARTVSPPSRTVSTAPAITRGSDSLELLSQTAWVGPGQGQFQLRLGVTASDAADETLAVNVYSALSTRSQFQAALGGDVVSFYYGPQSVPLSELPRDPRGGLDVDIPVNDPSAERELPLSATGVYPLQVFLEKGGVIAGSPLTTFIVYAGAGAGDLQRLNTDLVVPVVASVPISYAGLPGAVPSGEASTLRQDSAQLARWPVPVTIEAGSPTVEALAKGGPADALAVANLKAAVGSGDELLPGTALPLDLPALFSSNLASDVQAQLTSGSSALATLLGAPPSLTTWAFARGIDLTSMTALARLGAEQAAVPESDLSELPAKYQSLTFAQPTRLDLAGTEIDVVGADTELSSRISQAWAPGRAVLVANQVLAELAMIDLETPAYVRGVVLLPPAGATVNPTFLSVLLAGLQADPLLKATTLGGLFQAVPLAPGTDNEPLVRDLVGPRQATQLPGAEQLPQALRTVSAAGEVYGDNSALVDGLDRQLTVSLSSAFSTSQRVAIIAGVLNAGRTELGKIRLPPSTSITLTSRRGNLPLALLSTAGTAARVRLVLKSEQLSFVAQRFSEGFCLPSSNPGSETCELILSRPTTTLQVPVVVRTSGAFPLSLEVETPDGAREMATGTETVRSTAISDVGLALMLGAALFLGIWWVRNLHHGRRARRLVPRPVDEDSFDDTVPIPDPVGGLPG